MQTKICQSVGTGIVRYIGETYNFSLSAFASLTHERKMEIVSSISQSVSTAAKLEGHTTTLYYLTQISKQSRKRGVRMYLFIQTVLLSPESSKVMDGLIQYVRGEAESNPKKWLWGIYTTATKEELQARQSVTVLSTSSNQKTTADVPTMTQLSLFDSYQPNSDSVMSRTRVGVNGITRTSRIGCMLQSIIKRFQCLGIGKKNFTLKKSVKKLLNIVGISLQRIFLRIYSKSTRVTMRNNTTKNRPRENDRPNNL